MDEHSGIGGVVRGDPDGGLVLQPAEGLVVHYHPVQTPEEQLAMDAALDTLIGMALRKIVEERKYKDATRRGNDPILLELSSMVRE